MKSGLSFSKAALAIGAFACAPVMAQDAALTREVTITYEGALQDNVLSTYRRPTSEGVFVTSSTSSSSGQPARLLDAVDPYPINPGDELTLSITANLPTQEFIDANGVTPNPDGTYRFFLSELIATSPEGAIGFTSAEISEPFKIADADLRGGIIVDYNPATDSYVLADIGEGSGNSALIGGIEYPTYEYNADTNRFTVCGGVGSPACGDGSAPNTFFQSPGGNITQFGSAGTAQGPGLPTIGSPDASSPGFFDLLFSGTWSFFSSGTGPGSSSGGTEVPAPPMMILFGLAALAILRRRELPRAA